MNAHRVAVDGLRDVNDLRRNGLTVMFLAVHGRLAGLIAVGDPIKETTPAALRALHAEGLRIVMLTGDNRTTAMAVAGKLGIDEVIADVQPADKAGIIERLQGEGRKVAMAGDGINDAPALAQADVGIAMGTGTDIAMESAQVTLVRGDLTGIVRGPAALARDRTQHLAEPRIRVRLQLSRHSHRGLGAVPVLRSAAEPVDCCRRDEPFFGVRHRQRPPAAGQRACSAMTEARADAAATSSAPRIAPGRERECKAHLLLVGYERMQRAKVRHLPAARARKAMNHIRSRCVVS